MSTGLRARSLLSALIAASVLLVAAPASAQTTGSTLEGPYPEATRGEAAITSLGARLPVVAAQNKMSTAEFTVLLRTDETAWLDKDGAVFFVDIPYVRDDSSDTGSLTEGGIPLSEAFNLHSRPGANRIIYLDFTGHHSVNNRWNHDIVFPPFDLNGNSSTFSDGELASIIAHWQYMAEDFAPFDVDVTTEEPPVDRLIKSGGGDQFWGVRDLHTQATSGFGNGIGGVAYLNSFDDDNDNPVFSFNKGDNNGSMTGSHEVGHAFGLSHDGVGGSTYHPGTGSGVTSWGPIMGAPFGRSLVQWSNGDYANSTQTQDDYSIITSSSNGTAFRPDDFGDTVANASALPLCPDPSAASLTGLIETRNDSDAFTFVSAGGAFSASAVPADPGGNLDILLELYDGSGSLVDSDNPSGDVDANILAAISPGTYTLVIDGVGKSGSYSDYGCVGEYTVTVNVPVDPSWVDVGSGLAGSSGVPVLTGSGEACDGNPISLNLTNAAPSSPVFFAWSGGQLNLPFQGGTMVPNIFFGGGLILLQTNSSGNIPLASTWLAGPGINAFFQYWIVDAGGPQGFAASNAVELNSH